MDGREYRFRIAECDESDKNFEVRFELNAAPQIPSNERIMLDLILITLRVLQAMTELHPEVEPQVKAALEALGCHKIFDQPSLN